MVFLDPASSANDTSSSAQMANDTMQNSTTLVAIRFGSSNGSTLLQMTSPTSGLPGSTIAAIVLGCVAVVVGVPVLTSCTLPLCKHDESAVVTTMSKAAGSQPCAVAMASDGQGMTTNQRQSAAATADQHAQHGALSTTMSGGGCLNDSKFDSES